MNTEITRMKVSDITIGERRRTEMGDIAGLAKSIQEFGLLHPIIVDDEGVLIAGGRRLAAMQRLGFEDVPVRRWQTLGADDRRIIELEENLQRKDLTAYERSRNLTELAETAAKVDREEFRPESGQKVAHRPVEPGSLARVAERIDVPKQTIHDAQKHVAAAERYPLLQGPGWKQYRAMEAAEALDRLPESERNVVINLVDEPGIDPQTAVKIMTHIANKPASERKSILDLASSGDDRDRALAHTKAVELPPMPDPRYVPLTSVLDTFKRCIKAYPDDPETVELRELSERVKALIERINERHKRRVESAA